MLFLHVGQGLTGTRSEIEIAFRFPKLRPLSFDHLNWNILLHDGSVIERLPNLPKIAWRLDAQLEIDKEKVFMRLIGIMHIPCVKNDC